MKKVIAMVVCVAMLACFALTASAATKATFTIETVKAVAVGETVTVNLTIKEQKTMIGAVGFKFEYDKDYLEFVEDPSTFEFFNAGPASGGASAVGNEETMEVQMATANGFKAPGVVMPLTFKVIKEIPAGEIAAISATFTLEPAHAEDETVTYDATIVAGGVKAEAKEEPKPQPQPQPQPQPPVDGGVDAPEVEDVTVTDTEANPETGDVSGIAVAAGLCAVMAAAFVITKKVND